MSSTTPLHEAAESGKADEVRDLLRQGKYDVNCTECDLDKQTPLHVASSKGHLAVVRVLISEFMADPNTRLLWLHPIALCFKWRASGCC